ncbi:MAG: carbohydrate-binding protein [Spirochaetales bacterium]|nr:carbohydrate-binding protein [Spirochaetales bacterium]
MEIYVKNLEGKKMWVAEGEDEVILEFERVFEFGDVMVFSTSEPYVTLSIDPYLVESCCFIPRGRFEYVIPFGEKRKAYHPEAFTGPFHRVYMAKTGPDLLRTRRNLALNSLDKRDIATCFPHTDANVMTRDESVFESRNAIDGVKDNQGHGGYPFQSWGGGLRDDLEFSLFFGRPVEIDEVRLTLRADKKNDHDIHWGTGYLVFSDNSEKPIQMTGTTDAQSFSLLPKVVTGLSLNRLTREVSKSFSALSQIEVYGRDIIDL